MKMSSMDQIIVKTIIGSVPNTYNTVQQMKILNKVALYLVALAPHHQYLYQDQTMQLILTGLYLTHLVLDQLWIKANVDLAGLILQLVL